MVFTTLTVLPTEDSTRHLKQAGLLACTSFAPSLPSQKVSSTFKIGTQTFQWQKLFEGLSVLTVAGAAADFHRFPY